MKKENWRKYREEKIKQKKNPDNKRPVMVGIQRKKTVQISQLTSKASIEQINKKQKVKLTNTFPNKNNYVDTNTISKSKKTKKPFVAGKFPLNKAEKKVDKKDLDKYKEARKQRGR